MPTAVVADGDSSLREVLRGFLTQHGYTVHAAPDGPEALRLLQVEHPQLMLLGQNLPDLTGLDVLRYVHSYTPKVAVILISAAQDAATREAALALGALACLEKPVALHELEEYLIPRSSQDRRRVPRLPVPGRLAVRVPGLLGVHLRDLSSMGAQIEHLGSARVDAACTLDLPPPLRVLGLPAHVVWCSVVGRERQPHGEPHVVARSGLRFASLTPPQRAALMDALQYLAVATPP